MTSNESKFVDQFHIPAVRDIKRDDLPNFKSKIDISINQRSTVDYLLLLIVVIAVLGFFFVVALR